MIGPEAMAAVGFVLTLFGFAFGVWKYIDGKITALRLEAAQKAEAAASLAAMARADLAEYKIHAAENFATKSGMAEQTHQLLRAIESIGGRIDAISERLDRVFEQRANRRSS